MATWIGPDTSARVEDRRDFERTPGGKMARRVTATRQNEDGDVTVLCGRGWRRESADAIRDIELGLESYYVEDDRGRRARVVVDSGSAGAFLRTDPDADCAETLENQRPC